MSRGWEKLIERVGAKPFRPRHSTATGRRTPAWEHAELIDEPVRSRSTGCGYRTPDCLKAAMIDGEQPGGDFSAAVNSCFSRTAACRSLPSRGALWIVLNQDRLVPEIGDELELSPEGLNVGRDCAHLQPRQVGRFDG